MSTSGGVDRGLQQWIPSLVAALDGDAAGAGAQLREILTGRSARITLDEDSVIVHSSSAGEITVSGNNPSASPDGEGRASSAVVLALLDGRIGMNQAIISGDVELRSSIDDALWLYRAIELLLDGASRVDALRNLASQFRASADTGFAEPFVDWRTGTPEVELATLTRLGLLEDQRIDHDA